MDVDVGETLVQDLVDLVLRELDAAMLGAADGRVDALDHTSRYARSSRWSRRSGHAMEVGQELGSGQRRIADAVADLVGLLVEQHERDALRVARDRRRLLR